MTSYNTPKTGSRPRVPAMRPTTVCLFANSDGTYTIAHRSQAILAAVLDGLGAQTITDLALPEIAGRLIAAGHKIAIVQHIGTRHD